MTWQLGLVNYNAPRYFSDNINVLSNNTIGVSNVAAGALITQTGVGIAVSGGFVAGKL